MRPIKERTTGVIWHFLAWALGLLLLIPIFIFLFYFLAQHYSNKLSRVTPLPSANKASLQAPKAQKSLSSDKSAESLFLTSDLERNVKRVD